LGLALNASSCEVSFPLLRLDEASQPQAIRKDGERREVKKERVSNVVMK
jgi:hypothetical protein